MRRPREGRRPPSGLKLYDDPAGEQHIWEVREAGLGATAFVPGKADTHEGWEDSAVPPERLGEYLRRLSKLADEYGYESSLYGHYGQGCVHARWNFDLVTKPRDREVPPLARGRERPRARARRLAVGRARRRPVAGGAPAEDVRRAISCVRFEEFKSIWDPDWKMNPGKVVRPYRVDENLRLGADYEPWRPTVKFALPARRRRLRARDRPLRRRRQVPDARRRRRHVPVASWRRARRCTRPAAARASCSRCSKGERHHRRLAVGRGDGGARPLPRVQGLHERLPGQRRHADLQGGVPRTTAGSTGFARATPTRSG